MQTSRVRSEVAACATVRPAGTMASRNGKATVAPMPRRNVRRGICFRVMKSTGVSFTSFVIVRLAFSSGALDPALLKLRYCEADRFARVSSETHHS